MDVAQVPRSGYQNRSQGSAKMKVGDLLRILYQDGWFLVHIRGSHRQLKHSVKPGRVTIAGKPSDDIAPGTLGSVLKQAGLKR